MIDVSQGVVEWFADASTNLAHGSQEGLHTPAGKPPCWGGLQQHRAESDCSRVRDAECDDCLKSCEDEVEESVLPSAKKYQLTNP